MSNFLNLLHKTKIWWWCIY